MISLITNDNEFVIHNYRKKHFRHNTLPSRDVENESLRLYCEVYVLYYDEVQMTQKLVTTIYCGIGDARVT